MKFVPDDAGEWAGFLQAPAVKFVVMPCTVLVPGLCETGAVQKEVKLKSFWEMSSVRESFSKKIVFVNCRLLAVAEAEGRRRHAAPHTHSNSLTLLRHCWCPCLFVISPEKREQWSFFLFSFARL